MKMGIATDMKNLGEEIIASYDMRIKAVGELVTDTHKMIKGFHADHKEMSAALRKDLTKGEQERLKDFKSMMTDIDKFIAGVTKDVGDMIKGFHKEHKAMANELQAGLKHGETQRLKDFQNMMADIQKGIKEIETFVAKKLKEFDKAHIDMSEELRKELAKSLNDMVKATKKLMSEIGARQKERNTEVADLLHEFQAEREKMAAAWQKLFATMFRKRGGKMPQMKIEAGEKVRTVKKATAGKAKAKKKTMKKGKTSKRRVAVGV
jgi:hypothetical protein